MKIEGYGFYQFSEAKKTLGFNSLKICKEWVEGFIIYYFHTNLTCEGFKDGYKKYLTLL
jgi:hypothetical protein